MWKIGKLQTYKIVCLEGLEVLIDFLGSNSSASTAMSILWPTLTCLKCLERGAMGFPRDI